MVYRPASFKVTQRIAKIEKVVRGTDDHRRPIDRCGRKRGSHELIFQDRYINLAHSSFWSWLLILRYLDGEIWCQSGFDRNAPRIIQLLCSICSYDKLSSLADRSVGEIEACIWSFNPHHHHIYQTFSPYNLLTKHFHLTAYLSNIFFLLQYNLWLDLSHGQDFSSPSSSKLTHLQYRVAHHISSPGLALKPSQN